MPQDRETLKKLVDATVRVVDRPSTAPMTPAEQAAAEAAEAARRAAMRFPPRG
jgi:hypothetical protein